MKSLASRGTNTILYIKKEKVCIKKENMSKKNSPLYLSWSILKIVYGTLVLVAGIDKFFGILSAHNENLINPFITTLLPFSATYFLYGVGIFEIIIGIMILTNATYWGALLLMGWYLIIDINLLSMHSFYLIIINNVGHACAAFVLAQLTRYVQQKE